MSTRNLQLGSQVQHPQYGSGTVTFVGTDYVGIRFDDGDEVLIPRDALHGEAPETAPKGSFGPEILPWPASTFLLEQAAGQHGHGAHWAPFCDELDELYRQLPSIQREALVQTGYGEHRTPPRPLPEDWPQGYQRVWPLRTHGLAAIIRSGTPADRLVSLFPFFASGSQHTLRLGEVSVWPGGLEAQITADWTEGEVSFFDSQYLINRAWYEAERQYDFILSGIALDAGPARQLEFQLDRHPDQVAWMNQHLRPGEAPHEIRTTVCLEGAAVLLPTQDGDIDEYQFRGQVKAVEAFSGWLGQDGWKVRTTLMRSDDEDFDLDILVTRRIWTGEEAPRAGQEIEGLLWLQGYLWMPHRNGPARDAG